MKGDDLLNFKDISVPEVYKQESMDFRFFLRWIQVCLTSIKFDIENFMDLYDPLRCPKELLWMLADTIGFKYDDRLPYAYNRLVLMYFMSMIRNKGSKDGVTLAAEVNLAQFNILEYGKEKDILYDRLEDTSIPVNSAYVTPHVEEGYIDVVYFSDQKPIDACIEYVRPLGMYCFQHAGVRFDARTRVSVDARLTDMENVGISIGPTHIGHYRREDYARMQKTSNNDPDPDHTRQPVYYRNSTAEGEPDESINPGYRSLYSLQLCNNDHITASLFTEPIFSIGYGPEDVGVTYPDDYLIPPYVDRPNGRAQRPNYMAWNLRLNRSLEKEITEDVYTTDDGRTQSIMKPRPAVNPPMLKVGDAMSLNNQNTQYMMTSEDGESIEIKDSEDL